MIMIMNDNDNEIYNVGRAARTDSVIAGSRLLLFPAGCFRHGAGNGLERDSLFGRVNIDVNVNDDNDNNNNIKNNNNDDGNIII